MGAPITVGELDVNVIYIYIFISCIQNSIEDSRKTLSILHIQQNCKISTTKKKKPTIDSNIQSTH